MPASLDNIEVMFRNVLKAHALVAHQSVSPGLFVWQTLLGPFGVYSYYVPVKAVTGLWRESCSYLAPVTHPGMGEAILKEGNIVPSLGTTPHARQGAFLRLK